MSIAVYEVNSSNAHYCAVVGLGLLGSRIALQARVMLGCEVSRDLSVMDWSDPVQITQKIVDVVKDFQPDTLDLIWGAGKAGFSSSEVEANLECQTFISVIRGVHALWPKVIVSMLSSAGGLYEGSGMVTNAENLSPGRPYSFFKIRQEELLNELGIVARVFRIASVYGFGGPNSRAGLVTKMISSARLGLPVNIYGDQNTLRDYVYHDDIARHLIAYVLEGTGSVVEILASGRPTSIGMLQNLVTGVTERKVNVVYSKFIENAANILFSDQVIARSFKVTSLEEGVRLTDRFYNAGYNSR